MDLFEISITMSPATVEALNESGSALLALLGVYGADRTGEPTAWLRTTPVETRTVIALNDVLSAYLEKNLATGVVRESRPITLGQGFIVPASGQPTVQQGVVPGWVSIVNKGTDVWTSGLGAGPESLPIVAFTLHGNNALFIRPSWRVFLMLSPEPVPASGIVDRATGPGVLVDLGATSPVNLGYDIDQGWSWQSPVEAQAVAPTTLLQPLLVQVPPDPPDAAALVARLAQEP